MMRRLFTIACSIVAVAPLAVSSAARLAAGANRPITNVSISPTPVYDDLPKISVRFTTALSAPHGTRYFARYQAIGPVSKMTPGCSPVSLIDEVGVVGGVGKTVAITLRPEPIFGDSFCRGLATLEISEQLAGVNGQMRENATGKTLRVLATMQFRVFGAP